MFTLYLQHSCPGTKIVETLEKIINIDIIDNIHDNDYYNNSKYNDYNYDKDDNNFKNKDINITVKNKKSIEYVSIDSLLDLFYNTDNTNNADNTKDDNSANKKIVDNNNHARGEKVGGKTEYFNTIEEFLKVGGNNGVSNGNDGKNSNNKDKNCDDEILINIEQISKLTIDCNIMRVIENHLCSNINIKKNIKSYNYLSTENFNSLLSRERTVKSAQKRYEVIDSNYPVLTDKEIMIKQKINEYINETNNNNKQ